MKKIGVGIIGTGFAKRTQIPAFSVLENAEIVSVSSGKLENAKNAAEEFDIGHYSDDWRETVTHADVDLVCITTPPKLHREMCLFAIENNKHVLCEKPMAMNQEEAAEMKDAADKKGVLAIIDHELRFTNGRMKAYEMLRDGKIGKMRHVKYLFRNASRGNPSLPWTWWSDVEQGGGALGAIASHTIDTIVWFTGAPVTDVYCRLHTHVKERPDGDIQREVTSDDETMMILGLGESGLVKNATVNVSISLVEAGPYRNRVEFFGEKGAIRIEDGGEIFFADISDDKWESVEFDLGEVVPGMPAGGWSRGFKVLSDKIIEALMKGETTVEQAATFKDGMMIQTVLDAARKSDASGIVITL